MSGTTSKSRRISTKVESEHKSDDWKPVTPVNESGKSSDSASTVTPVPIINIIYANSREDTRRAIVNPVEAEKSLKALKKNKDLAQRGLPDCSTG